jgi:hypothetical protein
VQYHLPRGTCFRGTVRQYMWAPCAQPSVSHKRRRASSSPHKQTLHTSPPSCSVFIAISVGWSLATSRVLTFFLFRKLRCSGDSSCMTLLLSLLGPAIFGVIPVDGEVSSSLTVNTSVPRLPFSCFLLLGNFGLASRLLPRGRSSCVSGALSSDSLSLSSGSLSSYSYFSSSIGFFLFLPFVGILPSGSVRHNVQNHKPFGICVNGGSKQYI